MDFEPIGTVRSCFKERFGIPRQPGLVPEARAVLELWDTPEMRQALRGLEGFSHVWVIFVFHDALAEGWRPLVRPPRLGGERKMGVFATRSPHRPNPIGLSVVKLEGIEENRIHLSGVDLLDGTPVLDLKPYVPYADAIPDARAGWTGTDASEPALARLKVSFSAEADAFCASAEQAGYPRLRALIRQMLECDPRPAAQQAGAAPADYAAKLLDFDVHWRVQGGECKVTRVVGLSR